MEIKKRTIIGYFLIFILLTFSILDSFGLFEINSKSNVVVDLAKWQIKLNSSDITGIPNTFLIPDVHWNTINGVKPGKAAPGGTAYFEIIIDKTKTEVSVEYEISMDFLHLNNEFIYITSVKNDQGVEISVTEDKKYIGLMPLNKDVDTIRVEFMWENSEDNNEVDSVYVNNPNAFLDIPVTVVLSQYTG